MASPRRESDSALEDHRSQRGGGGLNGHTKWVVGVVSTAIVASLGWFVVTDRSGVERRLLANEILAISTAQAQRAYEAKSDARWEEIQRTLQEIKLDVKEVKRRQ